MNGEAALAGTRAAKGDTALAEPASDARPAAAPGPKGFARLRSAVERAWWESLEYLESAAQRHAAGILFAGVEKHSGLPLRVAYFGSGNHLAYVRDLLLRDWRVESESAGLRIWRARRWLARHAGDADVVVADLPWPWHGLLRGRGMLEVPAWINQRLRLPGRWQELLPKLRRSARGEDMRNIRKNRLEFRLVRDEQAVRHFYERMYVPHLTRRFGEAAYIEPEWRIRYCVAHGTLMEIRRQEELVAAQVLWGNRGMLHFLWAGTAGDGFGAETRGAFPALYYYGLLHAFESGYEEVDYCGSRPVLTDGIFQLKRRWGASVFDGWSRDTLFLRFRDVEGANLEWVLRNPLIARVQGGLVGKVLCAPDVSAADVERARQVYASEGIREIRLYSLAAPSPDALAAARAAPGIAIVDLSGRAEPAAAYCGD